MRDAVSDAALLVLVGNLKGLAGDLDRRVSVVGLDHTQLIRPVAPYPGFLRMSET